MNPTVRRRLRWALRGALILSGLAIVLGGFLGLVVALAEGKLTATAGAAFWLDLLLRVVLLWGLGALPFGAALGFYASMIWRDDR